MSKDNLKTQIMDADSISARLKRIAYEIAEQNMDEDVLYVIGISTRGTTADFAELDQQTVILVDDVANSGRTLCYAIKPMLEYLPKSIQIAVLIDRMHKQFPIQADYVGTSLSTGLHEYIKVDLSNEATAYLEFAE